MQDRCGFLPTVLFVDDDENLLNSVSRSLSGRFTVVRFTSPKAGIEWLENHSHEVHAIVVDMMMPDIDGIKFLTMAHKIAPDVPRLLLSGYVSPDVLRRAVNRGMVSRVLVKPVSTDELIAALDGSIIGPRAFPSAQSMVPGKVNRALSSGDYCVFIQPIVDPVTYEIVGGEMLSRFPKLQEQFDVESIISCIEDHYLVSKLAILMLEEIRRLIEAVPKLVKKEIRLNLNVSPFSICDVKFVNELIGHILRLRELSVNIIVEITEHSDKSVSSVFLENINMLRDKKIDILVDDFGAGNNSIKLLNFSAFDGIKIDRLLISSPSFLQDENCFARWLINHARSSGISVVAEGVEDLQTAETLRDSGVTGLQGYLFGRPENSFVFLENYYAEDRICLAPAMVA